MQTPVQIEFQGMDPSEALRNEIVRHVSGLEQRYARVTSCRVVLKAPGEHHREGGLYEVNIRLALPSGKEVNVDRTPGADERHADIHLLSTTHSSVHAAACRIRRAGCRGR